MRTGHALSGLILLLATSTGFAQQGYPAGNIQDNSFLVEESYNQAPGVVQHINSYQYSRQSGDWVYNFTQEWPVPGVQHQLSFTVPLQKFGEQKGGAEVGDVALNYRYQWIGDGNASVACAPRFTLLLPTGDERKAYGAGSTTLQLAIPGSFVLNPNFVANGNASVTYTPSARNPIGQKADTTAWTAAGSVIWLAALRFNALVEIVWTRSESVVGPRRRAPEQALTVSPGIRWSYNFASGLQIVPGVAFPLGAGPSHGERGVFLYLSFEHPFR